jgi:hypothetical protein
LIDDKSNHLEPDIRFYLNNSTLLVEFASMTTMFGLTVLARGQRWTAGRDEDVSMFSFPNYSVWTYDWNNEDDTPGGGKAIDPDNDLDWEIELVQRWMNGELLRFIDIVGTCDLIGVRDYFVIDLHPREEVVISRRYGLKDGIERSWELLAEELGVTPERIKQVASEALETIINRRGSVSEDSHLAAEQRNSPLAQLEGFARTFWRNELMPHDFGSTYVSLDTLCYLSFLYLASDFPDIESPGLKEVPGGYVEVASNIDLLLGKLSRRMIKLQPRRDFNQSRQFDLRQADWSYLSERARVADSRLESLLEEKEDYFKHLESWSDSELLDCLALSVQIDSIFESEEDWHWQDKNPMLFFLSNEQRQFGKFKQVLENEIRRR